MINLNFFKNNKTIMIILSIVLILTVFGITFAFFTYEKKGTSNNRLIVGKIYLHYNEGTDTLSLVNAFPETKGEALNRTNNYITFTIDGRNDHENKDIYYGIYLTSGDEVAGKNRLNPRDIRFQLIETIDGVDDVVVENGNYDDFNERLIYSNTVLHNTKTQVDRTYKLRMWIDENVLISDTDPNATYRTSYFANSYASVKVNVKGDFQIK